MSERIKIRDRRGGNKYFIDNFVYDIGLSCEGLAFYNGLSRYASAEDEQAFFSGKKFKKHHKVGHPKYESARKEVIGKNLVRATGEYTEQGAEFYELLDVSQRKIGTGSDAEQGPVLKRQRGGVRRQSRNNDNKQGDETSVAIASGSATESLNSQLTKACDYILKHTGCTLKDDDRWTRIWWYNAVKSDGIDNLKIAIRNFCANKANIELGQWDWISFFKLQAKRANYLPKKSVEVEKPAINNDPYAFLQGREESEIIEFLTKSMQQGAVWTPEIEKYRSQVEENLRSLKAS
jgi:hypothetical protein